MASSIIFLVVIGIWAAFLLPDLQLRRHDLAQSRAANKVLGSARTLTRGERKKSSADDGHADSSSGRALSAGASSGPDHKTSGTRAVDADAPTAQLNAAEGAGEVHEPAAGATPPTRLLPAVLAREGTRAEAKVGQAKKPATKKPTAKARRRTGTAPRPGKALQLLLALVLLGSLIAIPVVGVLAALHVLAVWAIAVPLLLFAASLVAMRIRARRRTAARRSAAGQAPVTNVLPAAERRQFAVNDQAVVEARVAKPDAVFDQEAAVLVEHGPTKPSSRPSAPRDVPGGWTPQAVPRPTYLMKPPAPHGVMSAPHLAGHDDSGDRYGDLLDADPIDLRDDVVDLRDPPAIDLRDGVASRRAV